MKSVAVLPFACILLLQAGRTDAQTISSDVGTTICKGTTVVLTADNYYEWERSTDNGYNWNGLGSGNRYASANIGDGHKFRAKAYDYSNFPPSVSYSNTLTFTVNGDRVGMNTINTPSRGSLQFDGGSQGLLMTPGFAVNNDAFTFETWFRLDEAAHENGMFVLLGAGSSSNFRAVSIIVKDPYTILWDSWGYGPINFTVSKMNVGTWYHVAVVRNGSGDVTAFLNGTRASSGVVSGSNGIKEDNSGFIRYVGLNPDGRRFKGLISNLRVVVGSAVYDPQQSSITVPTAPLASITGTRLLLSANNSATLTTDASGNQTLSAHSALPTWAANSPFPEPVTANRTLSNTVAGGTWSSSNTGVATVNASTGEVTPVANGSARISYSITTNTPVTCTSSDGTDIVVSLPCTTNDWTGGSGNWNVAGNWSCGSVPDGSTAITISSGTPTLNTDFTLPAGKSLTLSGTGSLVVAAGKILTIAGTADFGGRPVTLQSTASGNATIGRITGTLTNAGQVTVERYIGTAKRAWRLLTIPVTSTSSIRMQWAGAAANANAPTGETAGSGTLLTGNALANGSAAAAAGFDWYTGLSSASASSIRYYSHSGTAGSFSSSANTPDVTAAPAKQGYMLFVRGDRTVTTGNGTTTLRPTGTLRTGTQSVNVSQAYEVVGNPFAATIDADQTYLNGTNANVIERNFWVWDATLGTAGGFRAISYGGGSYAMAGGTGTATDYLKIQSGQAFFVQRKGGGGTLSIEEDDKLDGATTPIVFGSQGTPSTEGRLSVSILPAGKGLTDGVLLRIGDTYAPSPLEPTDMAKMNNFNENLSLLREGRYLSIESRPVPNNRDTAFLSFWNLSNGSHTLRIEPSGLSGKNLLAAVIDNHTRRWTDIDLDKPAMDLPFSLDGDSSSWNPSRFAIVLLPADRLPMEITGLKAESRQTGITLTWKTTYAYGTRMFEVEGSSNGTDFRTLATVPVSNTLAEPPYTWTDRNPSPGINHYRIRIIANNGTQAGGAQTRASWDGQPTIRIYPNPATGPEIALLLANQPAGRYVVTLYSPTGMRVHQKEFTHDGKVTAYSLPISRTGSPVSAGTCFMTIEDPSGNRSVRRLVISTQ